MHLSSFPVFVLGSCVFILLFILALGRFSNHYTMYSWSEVNIIQLHLRWFIFYHSLCNTLCFQTNQMVLFCCCVSTHNFVRTGSLCRGR